MDELKPILNKSFGLTDYCVETLEGYDSTNYKVTTASGLFVLKVYSYAEETFALLEAEHRVFQKLKHINTFQVPLDIQNKNNETLTLSDGKIFRLLPFIEGDFLAEIKHTRDLAKSFGTALAAMDKSLFGHYDSAIQGKETNWDLQFFINNRVFIDDIENPMDKSLVRYFFLQFNEHVYPIQHQFRKSVIHNDANDWNILTKDGTLSGIIDFGDMCHSWLINELAVGLTYLLMEKDNPLEIAKTVLKAYHEIVPLEEIELDVLYYLIAARLCTSVCNSANTKKRKPDSVYITISEKPAWTLLRKWLTINPIAAKDAFRASCGFQQIKKKNLEEDLRIRDKNISKSLSLSYNRPIQMSKAAFQFMYDSHGNTILDAYNNIMQVGHCHPKVVLAGQRAMANLNTNTRYLYDELLNYSETLLAKFPESLSKVFFVNSGSAATDLAIRIAKNHTNREHIMVLEHGYHGNTQNAIDISHYKYNHKGGKGKKSHIIETKLPKVYGSGFETEQQASTYYVKEAHTRISEQREKIAAFIAEPIVGCAGQVPLPKKYLGEIYPEIRRQGGLCISDEVQVGFGRLGSTFWGYEQYDVIPDIVILGKPIGNGHPLGAVVTTTEIADSFDNGMEFFSSFGGNPVSCAIGNAVLEVIEEDNLQENARMVGAHLKNKLKQLQERFEQIADVRGEGLFLGVEIITLDGLPNTDLAADIKNKLREKNILISTDGPYDSVLKIKPPLYFNIENANKLVDELLIILKES